MNVREMLRPIRCFFLDMDGTVYLSENLIDGTMDFVRKTLESGRTIVFLTNNSSHSVAFYKEKLRRLGIPACLREQLLTSCVAAEEVILQRFPGQKGYAVANREVQEELAARLPGCRFEWDWRGQQKPSYVLITFDTELTYEKLTCACNLIRQGVPYIATHPDPNCPVEGGVLPDEGATLAYIKASTGRDPDVIAGKPYPDILLNACRRMGLDRKACAMGGDWIDSDIRAGVNAGMQSILVMSGNTTPAILKASPVQPDLVFDRLADMIPYL